MGQLQQAGGAGEAFEGKIRSQTVTDHRDVQIHRDHEQLLSLFRGEELALIAEHTGQFGGFAGGTHHLKHIHLRGNEPVGLAAHAQTAHQFAAALSVLHPLFLVVVRHLH